ncbi:serine/threonine-protein kinase [Flindersiella endophytica]
MGELFAGRYELVDPLGQGGGLGSVWRAWDHKRQEYIAAKVLQHADAAALLRFVREQSYLVDHPHVVIPAGWAGEGDRVLFTMRMVCGGSTETLLDAYGTLPPEWVAVLLDQLLSALVALHALGIVHRDLKPANLLLEPTGTGEPQLCVSDFGIATQLGQPRLTRASSFVGTPGYMAPEQAQGAGPDPRQDLFACGAVAAELLRGRSPATPDGVPAALETEAPLGVPAPLWGVLRRLAARDPDERPADAAQARQELADSGSLPSNWPAAGGAGIQVTDHTPPFPADWGPEGPLGEPRMLVREGTGIPAAVFHRRYDEPEAEPEPAEAAEAEVAEARPEPAAEVAELQELPEVVEAPEPLAPEPRPEPEPEPVAAAAEPEFEAELEPEPEPELEPEPEPELEPLETEAELPTLQPSAAADLAPAEAEPEEDYEPAHEAELQPAPEPVRAREPEPELEPEPEPELEPSFRSETPVEDLLSDEQLARPEPQPPVRPEPRRQAQREQPARGPWATEPEWAAEPPAREPSGERERPEGRPEERPPVPSRFATPPPERRPPRRPTRQGPQPRPARPPVDAPRRERERAREPVQQSGPVWASDRPAAAQPAQPPRRRGGRVVRAVAVFATVVGAMLLLAAVALIYFR